MRATTTKRSVNKALGRAYSRATESPFWCQQNSFSYSPSKRPPEDFRLLEKGSRQVRPSNHAISLTEIAGTDTFDLLLAIKRSYFAVLGFGSIITVLTEFEPSRPTIRSPCLENQTTTSILAFPSTPLGQNVGPVGHKFLSGSTAPQISTSAWLAWNVIPARLSE